MGLYVSLLVAQGFDTKRKDFWVEFTHHILTLGLLSLSFLCGATRCGSIVILLHDAANGPLLVCEDSYEILSGYVDDNFRY